MTETLGGLTYIHEPGSAPHAPILLLLHGTGGDERQMLGLGRVLAPDAALLAPRGPVVEEGGAARFFRRIPTGDGSAYPFTFDEDEVRERTAALASFVPAALERHGLPGRPVVLVGFSNGANAGAALMLTRPDALRGAVLIAPMPILTQPPRPDLSRHAVLVASGRRDPIATPDGVETLAGTLAERGASVTVAWHDGGHELTQSTVAAARDWLGKLRQATAADPLP